MKSQSPVLNSSLSGFVIKCFPYVQAFHAVTRNASFSEGVRAAVELCGLGKLAPNMLLAGFRESWRTGGPGTEQWYEVSQTNRNVLGLELLCGLHCRRCCTPDWTCTWLWGSCACAAGWRWGRPRRHCWGAGSVWTAGSTSPVLPRHHRILRSVKHDHR